jgi:hypothetical protein
LLDRGLFARFELLLTPRSLYPKSQPQKAPSDVSTMGIQKSRNRGGPSNRDWSISGQFEKPCSLGWVARHIYERIDLKSTGCAGQATHDL